MLTTCPSPLLPLIVAVTTTNVSLFTKFRMHRSFLVLWPECATRSNLRACETGRTMRRIRMSSMIEEYLEVAGAMMPAHQNFGAVCFSQLFKLDVLVKEMWQNLFVHSWAVKSAKISFFALPYAPFLCSTEKNNLSERKCFTIPAMS